MAVPYVKFKINGLSKEINTYDTYGLILSKQEIGLPPVKTKYIDIDGRDGSLDMTEAFDEVYYGDRTLTFTFNIVSDIYTWDELRTKIAEDLHGRRCQITVYSDTSNVFKPYPTIIDFTFFYYGRCMIDKYQSSKGLGTIVIKCICEPFKYSLPMYYDITLGTTESTTVEQTFKTTGKPTQIMCNANTATSSYVIFKIDDEAEFAINGGSAAYYPTLIGPGEHTVQVTGQGSAYISFQERHI